MVSPFVVMQRSTSITYLLFIHYLMKYIFTFLKYPEHKVFVYFCFVFKIHPVGLNTLVGLFWFWFHIMRTD